MESTIVAFSGGKPILLRPGMITPEQMRAVLGDDRFAVTASSTVILPRSPGGLVSHYAPQTPVFLLETDALHQKIRQSSDRMAVLLRHPLPLAFSGSARSEKIRWRLAPVDAQGYARTLYANLRVLDRMKASGIYVEDVPGMAEWAAVRDRLCRAAYRATP